MTAAEKLSNAGFDGVVIFDTSSYDNTIGSLPNAGNLGPIIMHPLT